MQTREQRDLLNRLQVVMAVIEGHAAVELDHHVADERLADPLGVGVTTEDLVRALRFIVATPTYTGDVLVVDSGEHLSGRPRDIAFDTKKKK